MTDWGNYHNYQGVNRHRPGSSAASSHVRDPRLVLVAAGIPDIFSVHHILDVGCNAGAVAVQLALDFKAASVIGVDIDETLISKARSHLSFRLSRVRPAPDLTDDSLNYFPISAVLEYGHRDHRSGSRDNPTGNPQREAPCPARLFQPNVRFRCEDWLQSPTSETTGPFDVILALSVVKWIHLQYLDEGVRTLFQQFASCIRQGGYLVLEIQPWKSYENAVKAKNSLKTNFLQLRLRPDDFTGLLDERGLTLVWTSDRLPRRISVYQKGQPDGSRLKEP